MMTYFVHQPFLWSTVVYEALVDGIFSSERGWWVGYFRRLRYYVIKNALYRCFSHIPIAVQNFIFNDYTLLDTKHTKVL